MLLTLILTVLKRLVPVIMLVVVLIVGTVLGYLWGFYNVEIKHTGPWQLDPSYQGVYVQAVADAFAKDSDTVRAIERLSYICQENDGLLAALGQAGGPYGRRRPELKANLNRLAQLIASKQVVQAPGVCNYKAVDALGAYAQYSWVIVLLLALGIIGYGVNQMLRPSSATPAPAASAGSGERFKATVPVSSSGSSAAPVIIDAPSAAAAGAKISSTLAKTDFTGSQLGAPIVQFMTTYVHGDELYDDSFSIETSSGDFLGETGVGISETISGSGEAKKVSAFEVWLFDKNDIRTVTRVLMSDHAFNDDAIRAKLAPKGEAMLIKAGDKITLETATLRVQARIVDLSYGTGPVPPNSFFERITIELAAWKREGAPAQGAAGGTPAGGLPSLG